MDPGFGIMVSKWADKNPPPKWLVPSLVIIAAGALVEGIKAGSREDELKPLEAKSQPQDSYDNADLSLQYLSPPEVSLPADQD